MKILLFADIHIGTIKNIDYVNEVISSILEKEFNERVDAVIILGDYFHKSLQVNDSFTKLAINIMSYLIMLCKLYNTKVRILYGTESHEANQYHLFNYHLNNKEVDIKVIDTVTEEELFPNTKVLYIPEEYVTDKEKHYKLYFNKKYNFVFGHGVILEGMPMVAFNKSKVKLERYIPHFKHGELSKISDICIFGHYHRFTDLGDNVYYLGSLFRDSFGEEENKGYGIIKNNEFQFIENNKAYIYRTYSFDIDSDVYKDTDTLIKQINSIKEENKELLQNPNNKCRFIFNLPDDIDITFKDIIRSLFINEKQFHFLIKENNIQKEVKEKILEINHFLLDNSLSIEEKISKFINNKSNTLLSPKDIKDYINK